jgi:ADP-heptose:LPS heptosyltransferase
LQKHILVIRLSAIGDVAIAVPVLCNACEANPEVQFTVLTKKHLAFLFPKRPNLSVLGIDTNRETKGLSGLWQLRQIIKQLAVTDIIDLHDVLRTRILQILLWQTKWTRFDKARALKHQFISSKQANAVVPTIERYQQAFVKAGLQMQNDFQFAGFEITQAQQHNVDVFASYLPKPFIALAPFAAHASKSLPLEKIHQFIEASNKPIILFAGGEEKDTVLALCAQYSHVRHCYELGFAEQVALMKFAAYMVAVDSSNMHLAALQGVPLVSIWGATHPSLGFAPVCKAQHKVVQLSRDAMPCRPCSVYGNKACTNSQQYACLHNLSIEEFKL